MFICFLLALVVVVAAVTLAVVGAADNDEAVLPEVAPERLTDPLPADRPLAAADVESVRLPMTLRGYRMTDVDEVLGRLGAELAERDARIAELETALAGARAVTVGGPGLFGGPQPTGPAPAAVQDTAPVEDSASAPAPAPEDRP
ncbi:DivIVA domain-containing protein [Streptomyces sp. NPDC060194]|uniref:DivIVA domain-containing protein n=1 Tax=Streptomyces sp. NPDC060194 TaxID=3347069 RepID=UPI003655986E